MIKLDLDVQEVQIIVGALHNLPHGQVRALMDKLQAQIDPQLNALREAASDAVANAEE